MTVLTERRCSGVTRNAYPAFRAFGERLAVLPTAASIRVPVAPPTAARNLTMPGTCAATALAGFVTFAGFTCLSGVSACETD
jgi:hypothetical protein